MFNYAIRINRVKNPRGKVMAFATIIIEDTMEVTGFKVINGAKGLFVSAPQTPGKPDDQGKVKYYDDVRFVDQKAKEEDWRTPVQDEIYKAIITQYEMQGGVDQAAGSAAQASAASARRSGDASSSNKPQMPLVTESNSLW